jgi:hypothetical protein
LQNLRKAGIYAEPALSIEHQRSSNRYVIRGQESGGAVAEFGAYCGFAAEDGQLLSWAQRVDSLAHNGIHARVVAPSLVRLQIVRVLHTYDLLITKHLLRPEEKRKPMLQNLVIFRGRQGTLELELWGKDDGLRGGVCPIFLSRAGEPLKLPATFQAAIQRVVAGVTCLGCRRPHLLIPPQTAEISADSVLAGAHD